MAENLQGSQVIAKIFSVSTRRVEQLKTEGIIQGKGKPTKYDLLPTIQAYIKYLSDKANGREKKETTAQIEADKLNAEKRIKEAKAEMAELELKELKGDLHRASDVEAITTDHVLYLRSMLLALPGKLAVDVAALSTAPECSDRIRQEVYAVLNSLANYRYDPNEYKRRMRERQGWNDGHGAESDEE